MKRFLLLLLLFSGCDKISPTIGTNERGLLFGTIPAVLGYDNQVRFVESSKVPLLPWQSLERVDVANKSLNIRFDEKLKPNENAPLINCKVSYHVRDTKDDLLNFRGAFNNHDEFREFLQTLIQNSFLRIADLSQILFSDAELLRGSLAKDVAPFGVDLIELSITEFFDEKAINAEKEAIIDLEQKIAELKETILQKKEGLSSEQATQITALQNKLVSTEVEAELIRKKADNEFDARKKEAESILETGRLKLKELEEVANFIKEQ